MHTREPLAILADIHGNSAALEAVLAHAQGTGISRFVNLGDTFYGPLDPRGTWDILRSLPMPTVLGNQDRVLIENPEGATSAIRSVRQALGEPGLTWIENLPTTTVIDGEILLTHGTPASDTSYLLEDVASGRPIQRDCAAVEADILPGAETCSLVLTGHSHFPGSLVCGDRTVVNPGSVGLPAYDDDTPPHAMAAGSPHARYAVACRTAQGWDVSFKAVEYDWEKSAVLAETNGRDDWARWLRTGMA